MVQCIESFKSKIKVLSMFQSIEDNNDAILFLYRINEFAFIFEAHEYVHVYLWKTKHRTVNTYQNHLVPMKYL